ncbi:MAG: flagellar biosynthesis protein FlhF [Gammaproteobacteria bacterium]|nr:flagellar biosynthesis protein FlhF [Gammaproteobacteria bacterium]
MKIKRYYAKDIRQAMRLIREEQGPDAVILSNKRTQDGVEIVAATDYDEHAISKMTEPSRRTSLEATPSVPTNAANDAPKFRPADVDSKKDKKNQFDIQWSQDPLLIEMRNEIEGVKSLLKDQLSAIAWNEASRSHPYRAELIRRLLRVGLSAGLCKRVLSHIDQWADRDELWHQALDVLAGLIPVARRDWLAEGGVFAMIGPTGVGKTTTTAKIAARGAMRYGRHQVALITIDNYRVGAYEQLRTYGRILNVPVRHATSRESLAKALAEFEGRRLILIDSAGMNQHDASLSEHMAMFEGQNVSIRSFLLLSATTSLAGLMDVADSFSRYRPAGCIVTKIDEAVSLGGAVSAAALNELPIIYSCDGQNVPEDIQAADAGELVSRCVKLGETAPEADAFEFSELTGTREVVNARI